MNNHFITIIQQGTSPKVVEAAGTLRETLNNEGVDVSSFVIMSGGREVDLDAQVTNNMTVTATKRSTGA